MITNDNKMSYPKKSRMDSVDSSLNQESESESESESRPDIAKVLNELKETSYSTRNNYLRSMDQKLKIEIEYYLTNKLAKNNMKTKKLQLEKNDITSKLSLLEEQYDNTDKDW